MSSSGDDSQIYQQHEQTLESSHTAPSIRLAVARCRDDVSVTACLEALQRCRTAQLLDE
jgi:hypothetical protein